MLTEAAVCAILIYNILDELEKETPKKIRLQKNSLFEMRENYSHVNLIKEMELKYPLEFSRYLRVDIKTYHALLEKLTPIIIKSNTIMKEAITPNERLTATLKYLAGGCTLQELKFITLISISTLSSIIMDTCKAIIIVLKDYIKVPKSECEWRKVAYDFENMYGFPNCIGAVDGKHININKPRNSGNVFLNYKGNYSIVLMAVVNAKREFSMVSVGASGKNHDSTVFQNTKMWAGLEEQKLNLPNPSKINDNVLPYVLVGDSAFPLKTFLMTPYKGNNLTEEQDHFNYCLSRARAQVECAFGALVQKFRILLGTINLSPEKTRFIVMACCYLHNFIKSTKKEQEQEINYNRNISNNGTLNNSAQEIRERFLNHFNNKK